MSELPLKLLIVDDDRDFANYMNSVLSETDTLNLDIDHVENFIDAQREILAARHDAYLIDYKLGSDDGDGMELIRSTRKMVRKPMVMMTSCDQPETGDRAISVGACDFLNKQHATTPVIERVLRNAVSRNARRARERIEREALEEQLHTDYITGMLSRVAIEHYLTKAMQSCDHSHTGYLMYLDLNHFKPVNDYYGHTAGDQALKIIGTRLKSVMREGDYIGRLGGDEFLLVGRPETEDPFADNTIENLIEALRDAVEEPMDLYDMNGEQFNARVSVSIGVVKYDASDKDRGYLIALADKAMYIDKKRRSVAHA